MTHKLVIVESPTKAKKIGEYLGKGYVVESSLGHVRDLPESSADIPAAIKGKPWARMAVDVENNFEPYYVVSRDRKSHLAELKRLLKDADELYLATDEDREGEAIAWHLLEELKPKNIPVKRMVFHEITKNAILEAAANPRELDKDLVEAQEARRILDRLFGYELSPVLWKKIGQQAKSAGRVQSVATRLVVERERERIAFRSASYWDLEGSFDAGASHQPRMFPAKLYSLDGVRVARGGDFNDDGTLTAKNVAHVDRSRAEGLVASLEDAAFDVLSVESKPYKRTPPQPFRTTTLQQEAGRKLGMSSSVSMRVAQALYENGLITYMRTDSTDLSATAIAAAQAQVTELYGAEYVATNVRKGAKAAGAQEAHEAIRPAGERFLTPKQTGLSGDQFRLYELIWMRTVASQMKDAVGQTSTIKLTATALTGEDVVFSASGTVITFHGFLKAYVEGKDDADELSDDAESRLPAVVGGDRVSAASIKAEGHETKPPARYTEASLIKALEDRGIGRPSTYASIMSTIQNRGYVTKKGSALVPAWVAFVVIRLLEENFARYVDYDFTALLETALDEIAGGRSTRVKELEEFYFGSDRHTGLKTLVDGSGEIDAKDLNTIPIGEGIDLRSGRYGPYIETVGDDGTPGGKRASVPDELAPDELTVSRAKELLANPAGEEIALGKHPESGLQIVAKSGRFGPYVTEVVPEDAPKGTKGRTGSLFKSMSLDTITLEQALQLLSLPRVVGTAEDGEEITAQNGRYGPYLKKGADSRTIASEDLLLTMTMPEALAIYAQPKYGGRRAATPPLKEFGADPVSGKPVVVKDGRFGPYVTDGETNATLRKDDPMETLTAERAYELIAEKRAKGPAKKTTRKAPAKKAAKKTTAKKTAAKKATAKKAAKKA